MEKTGSVTRKVAKVRTFRDDAERARSGGTTPHDVSAQSVADAAPSTPVPKKDTSHKESAFSKQTIFKATPKPATPPSDNEKKPALPTTPKKPADPIAQPTTPAYKEAPSKPSAVPNQINVNVSEESVNSIMSSTDQVSVMDADDYIQDGTIVTDKKLEHYNLFTSMWLAVKDWFVEEKTALEERAEKKRKAIPTVRSIEDRRDIVEKASKQSALAPKDDHRKLAKKLPPMTEDKKSTDAAALTITKKSEVKAPEWSHFTGRPEEPETPVVKAERPAPKPVVSKEPPVIPAPPEPEEEPVPLKKAEPPVPTPAPAVPKAKPAPVKVVGQTTKRSSGWIMKAFAYSGVTLVTVAAIASGVGLTWWLFSGGSESGPIVVKDKPPEITALVRYDELVQLPLPNRKEELWQGILGAEIRSGTNMVVIVPMGPTGEPALPEDVMAVMDIQAPGSFVRNVSDINFGTYRSQPFIIMTITAFDTAFGGMLSAEGTLKDDLTLFSQPGTSSPSGQFVDDVVQNHDVRVLKDSAGNERFIYGFVNRNTILIAKDRDTFTTVAEAVQ